MMGNMARLPGLFTLKTKRILFSRFTLIVFMCFQIFTPFAFADDVNINLAYSYMSKGDHFKANSIFFRALSEGIYIEESHYGLATGYALANKQSKAMQQVDKLLTINPQHVKGLLLKSTLLLQSGDATSAIVYLESLKQLDSENPEVWLLLENTYALLGDANSSKAAMSEYDRLTIIGK